MRSHILVATMIAALASLIVAASATACELTDGSLQSVNGTYYEPHGPTVPISPGDEVTFTFAGLLPGATYTVTYNGDAIPYEEVHRWPAGATAKFTVPDLGSGATDGAWKIEPVPGEHDNGTMPRPTELNVKYRARASTPAPDNASPTGESPAPQQPSSTQQPAGGTQSPSTPSATDHPATVVTETTLSQPASTTGPVTAGHISQIGGVATHPANHPQTTRSRAARTPAAVPAGHTSAKFSRVTRPAQRAESPAVLVRHPEPQPTVVPQVRAPVVQTKHHGASVPAAIVVGLILVLAGLAGYGGTRVLVRRTPPRAPEPPGPATATAVLDPVEIELQQMLAEEQAKLAAGGERELIPL